MSESPLCRQEVKFGEVSGETKIPAPVCLMEEPELQAAGPPRSISQPVQWVDLTYKSSRLESVGARLGKERKDAWLACKRCCGPGVSVLLGTPLPFLAQTFFPQLESGRLRLVLAVQVASPRQKAHSSTSSFERYLKGCTRWKEPGTVRKKVWPLSFNDREKGISPSRVPVFYKISVYSENEGPEGRFYVPSKSWNTCII